MKQVEFNTKNENPFYGMQKTLGIFQTASKGGRVSPENLKLAWKECKDVNQQAVLLSILFSIGDVTGRQHNLFETKVESGGNAQRDVFRDDIIPFLVKITKGKKKRQELMALITEYTVMDNILANRVLTKRKTANYIKTINMIDVFDIEEVAKYCANIILNGTTFQKICLAKFISRPRFSKRAKSKRMLPETKVVMQRQSELLSHISNLAGLAYEDKGSYVDFTGFYNWRKEYNLNNEAYLFSSGKIKDLDKEEFFKFLQQCPSDARFRVRNRVLFDQELKWKDLGKWYKEWETFKDKAQSEQRVLETKIDNGIATDAEKAKLKSVKKKAKVNTGSIAFPQLFKEIMDGTVDKVKIQPFLDKVNLPYNNLIIMDSSASMRGGWSDMPYKPCDFGAFMATISLMKNPSVEGRNLIGLFAGDCRMYNGFNKQSSSRNSLLLGKTINVESKPLIDNDLHFLDNFKTLKSFLHAMCNNGMTNVSAIPDYLHKWAQGHPERLEQIMTFPIWTLISDGEFNNMRSPEASMNDFMRRCEKYFGFKPYIILIDVNSRINNESITRFSGVDNLMVVPPNPASIEMFLTNFRDMDTYDVYTPLQSIYRSKRYAPIRDFVYDTKKISKKEQNKVEA